MRRERLLLREGTGDLKRQRNGQWRRRLGCSAIAKPTEPYFQDWYYSGRTVHWGENALGGQKRRPQPVFQPFLVSYSLVGWCRGSLPVIATVLPRPF